jgi:beta-1,4-N-acetylglucosaminyltransferase
VFAGTCVPICFVAFFYNVLGISRTKIIYVESFCRVKKLSLSGKLLYYIADKFIVQWPGLLVPYPRAEYLGAFGHPTNS